MANETEASVGMQADGPLLRVRDLGVRISSKKGSYRVVDGVGFDVARGEILGIVGESGCGKSMTMSAVMGLLPDNAAIDEGTVELDGTDVRSLDRRSMEQLRGGRMAMVFQDPMTALDPLYTVGSQIGEAIRAHLGLRGQAARDVAIDYLRRVGLSEPEKRLKQYPFELSGGMRQRVIIAIALCCRPDLLICDEPTTALDVTIQARILDLIRELHEELGGAVVFISHNMGVIASLCDRVLVMYAGRVVERGTVWQLFNETAHPYTKGLLTCVPSLDGERSAPLVPIPGTVGNPRTRPVGCPFAPRCGRAMAVCLRACPPEFDLGAGHGCACWLACDAAKEAHEHGER
ncbi:MAG: ABC transporter ATP-binding protein [Coriobacteriia bacterium]|nr:ABC transporter ATP-binding protein [Coriobacteriia bacterium]MBS5478449.1 ABC transporter ATP-binding protein [Coriobacteriia bacterium]